MGDLTRGNVAAVAVWRMTSRARPNVCYQPLAYPRTRSQSPVFGHIGLTLPFTDADRKWLLSQYVRGEAMRDDRHRAPSLADLSSLPPTFISTFEHAPLPRSRRP